MGAQAVNFIVAVLLRDMQKQVHQALCEGGEMIWPRRCKMRENVEREGRGFASSSGCAGGER